MIDQLLAALVVAAISSFMSTPLAVPEPSNTPGDTDLLQVGGAAYWALPAFGADSLGVALYPDAVPQRVDYPGTAFGFIDLALGIGVNELDHAVKDAAADGSEVVVIGHSEGSMVVDHLQADYLADPDAPPSDKVTFVIYGSPERGILHLLFPDGTVVPGFAVTTQAPIESQYDTIVVTGEYDLAADPPDRPWNLLALANAAVGFATVHHAYAFIDPDTIPPENSTTDTNSQGAQITTVLIPTEHLPLTAPVRIVAPELANRMDKVLRPVIDSAYVRHNDQDPYLSGGRLVVPDDSAVKRESGTIADGPSARAESARSESLAADVRQEHKPVRDALARVKDRDKKHFGADAHGNEAKSFRDRIETPKRNVERAPASD